MTGPRHSFVIPCYRDAQGVARQLAWFAGRSEEIEVIVVDDASPEDIEAVVRAPALPANVTLHYLRNDTNLGPGPSRNRGLAQASGDHLSFLDADDLLTDSFFAYTALSPLRNGADFVMIRYHLATGEAGRHSYRMHRIDDMFFSNMHLGAFPARVFSLEELPSALRTVNYPWNKIYRTGFLHEAGISFPDQRMHEDIQPHWQSFLRARRFGVMAWAPPLIHHFERQEGRRATNYVGRARMAAFELLGDAHEELLAHPWAELLEPELRAFAENLFAWILKGLGPRDGGTRALRAEYETAIAAFLDRLPPLPLDEDGLPEAPEMGRVLPRGGL